MSLKRNVLNNKSKIDVTDNTHISYNANDENINENNVNIDMYGFLRSREQIETLYTTNFANIEKQRSREIKWFKMLGLNHKQDTMITPIILEKLENLEKMSQTYWEIYRKKNIKKVNNRCNKGIPNSIRGKAWIYLSESYKIQASHIGESPLNLYNPSIHGKMEIMNVIDRDIDRCFPEHIQFRNVNSQTQNQTLYDLELILKSYALYNPTIGYCQGMGMIVGMMLMNMPAEDAFWLLVVTCDRYLRDFFVPELPQVRAYADIFHRLLTIYLPIEAKHLDKHSIEPLMYCTSWFMTIYTTSLPWAIVLRIWDIFYNEGNVILLVVAIAIIKILRSDILKLNNTQDIFLLLLHLPENKFEEVSFIKLVLALKIKLKIRIEQNTLCSK